MLHSAAQLMRLRGEKSEFAEACASATGRTLRARVCASALVILGAVSAACGSSDDAGFTPSKNPDAGAGSPGTGGGGAGTGGAHNGGSGGLGPMATGGARNLKSCQTSADCLGNEICASNVCVILPGTGGRGPSTGGASNGGAGGGSSGGRFAVGGHSGSGGSVGGSGGLVGGDSGVSTGGSATGGAAGSGGAGTGGTPNSGGASTDGGPQASGGASTGGVPPSSGGASTGGASTGGASPGSGGASTGGAGGRCAADSESCTIQSDCCGYPDASVCTNVGSSLLTCTPLCNVDGDCSTGCCVPQPGGFSACGPASMCPQCVAPLDTCVFADDCCGYPTTNRCVDFGQLGVICAYTCNSGSECNSGCCAPVSGAGASVCAPTTYCPSCSGNAEPCSTDLDCCGTADANFCVDFGVGGQCTSSCFSDLDCSITECCLPLVDGGAACGPC